jgi:ribosomal-protein-alanine N-acetyltransferase
MPADKRTGGGSNGSMDDGVVHLRPSEDRDLEAIDAGIHDFDVVRWLGRPKGSAAQILALNRSRAEEGSPTFSICEADDACVGLVWLNRGTHDPGLGYVGYWLLPAARGRGLATRAVRLLAASAFGELALTGLRLLTEPANEPSQQVAERAGFHRVGLLEGFGEVDGTQVDEVLFALAPDTE